MKGPEPSASPRSGPRLRERGGPRFRTGRYAEGPLDGRGRAWSSAAPPPPLPHCKRDSLSMIRSPLMTVMTDAVMKASRSLKRDFGELENLQVSRKGPGDFVSAADRKAEQILREALEKARPGYGLVMEESGIVEGADKTHKWHIDPLDGTTNFLHGLPQFAISVGLERDGQIVAGVVYDPALDEMFIAEKGKGAYLNNRRIRVAARSDLA